MKKTLVLITFLFISFINFAHAKYVFSEYWAADYSPKVKVTCTEGSQTCLKACGQLSECEYSAVVCRDCISTSMLMTNIFENMTVFYRNSGESVEVKDAISFLKTGRFVAISSRSIYNQTDSFDSDELRIKFQNLCPTWTKYPVVLFSLKEGTNVLDEARYVTCDTATYKMTTDKDLVESAEEELIQNRLH